MTPRLGVGVCEALTRYLNQVCSGHILGVGAKPKGQRWTQDPVKKKKKKTLRLLANTQIAVLSVRDTLLSPERNKYLRFLAME